MMFLMHLKFIKEEVENQLSRSIKFLRSDRGNEYFYTESDAYYEEYGIIHEYFAPRTPQQNGLAEIKNHTYQEIINVMVMHSILSFNLWGEASLFVCHIINRIILIKPVCLHMSYGNPEPHISIF